uniref:Protease n=1 Tax=viral metagenome TaxID=1070528 RepID=A0A6C0IH87_9ZZZZ
MLFAGNVFHTTNSELIEFKKDNFVSLREVINQDSSSKLLLKLNTIESKHETLYLYINSPGGSVMAGLEIINYIKSLQQRSKKIICIAHNAMSMAFVIFQYCSERCILHSSTLMQHQMSLGIQGKLYDINSRMSYLNSLETKLNHDQASRLNMTEDKFTKLIQNDWWLYSDDIINNNVADKMVSIFCSFDNYDEQVIVNTIFGEIQIKYSACPLINYPLHIVFPTINFSEKKKSEFMDTHINFIKKYI